MTADTPEAALARAAVQAGHRPNSVSNVGEWYSDWLPFADRQIAALREQGWAVVRIENAESQRQAFIEHELRPAEQAAIHSVTAERSDDDD